MSKHCYTHLNDTDRETLSLGLTHGQSLRAKARVLGPAQPPAPSVASWAATPREATSIAPARHSHGQTPKPVSRGDGVVHSQAMPPLFASQHLSAENLTLHALTQENGSLLSYACARTPPRDRLLCTHTTGE